jgi:uncharacterized membrane protein
LKHIIYLLGCIFIYFIFSLCIVIAFTHRLGIVFFVWNVFLAFLPYLFARLLGAYLERENRKKTVVFLLAFLWLIFFPNAPYMITDLKYVGMDDNSIYNWVFLIYIASGAVFSMLMGLSSLGDIHQMLLRRIGRLYGNLVLALAILAGGFAVYVGRFLRFNSWDVLQPFSLLQRIKDDFSSFSIVFSLLFSAFIFGTYLVYYVLLPRGGRRTANSGDTSANTNLHETR